jgi:chaperonin GroEL (HSP60 family)
MAKMSNFYKRGLNPRIDTSRLVTENNPLVYDSASIKKLAVISATETATSVLRIDKILLKK